MSLNYIPAGISVGNKSILPPHLRYDLRPPARVRSIRESVRRAIPIDLAHLIQPDLTEPVPSPDRLAPVAEEKVIRFMQTLHLLVQKRVELNRQLAANRQSQQKPLSDLDNLFRHPQFASLRTQLDFAATKLDTGRHMDYFRQYRQGLSWYHWNKKKDLDALIGFAEPMYRTLEDLRAKEKNVVAAVDASVFGELNDLRKQYLELGQDPRTARFLDQRLTAERETLTPLSPAADVYQSFINVFTQREQTRTH